MLNHIFTWAFKSLSVFLIGIPITLLGFPLVAVALPFRKYDLEKIKFSQYPELGCWQRVTLPKWARWWSNEFDGAYGDKRGWWSNYCCENYGKDHTHFYSMWQWLACRNPANYWSRVVSGCDVSQCVITKLAGDDVVTETAGVFEWQFLVATNKNGTRFHRFFFVMPWWFRKDKAIMFDIGWKIKLSHNGMSPNAPVKDRIRGSVFTPSFWKSL